MLFANRLPSEQRSVREQEMRNKHLRKVPFHYSCLSSTCNSLAKQEKHSRKIGAFFLPCIFSPLLLRPSKYLQILTFLAISRVQRVAKLLKQISRTFYYHTTNVHEYSKVHFDLLEAYSGHLSAFHGLLRCSTQRKLENMRREVLLLTYLHT